MPIFTRRWDDPPEPTDGTRILITRYRPRGLKKEFETWSAWYPELAPSIELHAAAYGKNGLKIGWEIYRRRYLAEMKSPDARARIAELAARLRNGETLTLLCSSACTRESRCHRSLLAELLEQAIAAPPDAPAPPMLPSRIEPVEPIFRAHCHAARRTRFFIPPAHTTTRYPSSTAKIPMNTSGSRLSAFVDW